MSLVGNDVLRSLSRMRIVARAGGANAGPGERASRLRGAGLDFEDHRAYQVGDDLRRIDPHVLARLGQHVVRQYSVDQALHVSLLVDTSRSMTYGRPAKSTRALQVVAALAGAALAGGDFVRLGALRDGKVAWHSGARNPARLHELFRWLRGLEIGGETDLVSSARSTLYRISAGGLLVVVSDLMDDAVDAAFGIWQAAGQEVVAMHLLAPEEEDPERLGRGTVRLVDAETRRFMNVELNARSYALYREQLEIRRAELAGILASAGGRYYRVRSDAVVDVKLLHEWRRKGLLT